MKRIFLLLYLTVTSLLSFQSTIDLNNLQHHITDRLVVYEDPSAKLDFEDIVKLPKTSFAQIDSDAFSSLFSSSAFWYKLEVNNTQSNPVKKLFIIEPAWLDYLQINIISPNGKRRQYEVGNTFNYSQRSIDSYHINQLLSFEPGSSTLYIQMKTRDPFIFILSVLDVTDFLNEQAGDSLIIGLLYGTLLAMVLSALFLFIATKENYYLHFVIYISSFVVMSSVYNGYTFKFFFYDNPELQNFMQSTSIYLFAISTLLFAQSFLNIKKRSEICNNSFNIITAVVLLAFIISALFGGYKYHIISAMISIVIVSFYVVVVSLYSLYHSNPTARFFVLGTGTGLIGIIVTSFTYLGIFPYTHISIKAVDIGMTLNAIILSLALADRIKQAQQEKIKAEAETKAKSIFLSNMSHEIRTPMNAIVGMSQLALETDLNNKQRNLIQTIDSSSKTLLRILNDILDFSKSEAGKLTIVKTDFNLIKLINEITDLMRIEAEKKNIKLNVKYDDDFKGSVHGDSTRINQILTNLINNAIKFTDSGEINIYVRRVDTNRYKFEVADTGIGISADQQKKLFNSFAQADTSTTRGYGGTGLGLAISKQLVELMNGDIWVQSEIDVGSNFIFEIELLEIEKTDEDIESNLSDRTEEKSLEGSVNILRGKKILLVEDNSFNQDVIIYSLEKTELAIDIANNGQEAVDMFNDDYDLILMDIQMPMLDGYEATRLIREKNIDIPIIALSANVMEEDIEKAKDSGIDEYLTKPIDFKSLNRLLLEYLTKN